MPRMNREKKFDVHVNSIEAKLLTLPSEIQNLYFWNRRVYYEEFYQMEAWAAMGFISGASADWDDD